MMEYYCSLWADSPASHLAQLDTMETKAFKISEISRDEAEAMGLSLHHCRLVGGLSVFFHLISGLAPSVFSMLYRPPTTPPPPFN